MKLQLAWPIVALIGGMLAFLSWSSASSEDEKPIVSSTTGPYYGFHDFEIFGTTKITTESYKRYTVRTELTSAQSRETPPKKWSTYKYISYRDLHGNPLQWGLSSKDAGLGSIKEQTYKSLMWNDTRGVETTIGCNDVEYANGHRYHQRVLERGTVDPTNLRRTDVGGFSVSIERDENGTVLHQEYEQFEPRKDHFRKVHWLEDTSGCDDARFPFQLLKEKPLYLRS